MRVYTILISQHNNLFKIMNQDNTKLFKQTRRVCCEWVRHQQIFMLFGVQH